MFSRRKIAARFAAALMTGAMVLPMLFPATATDTPCTAAVFQDVQIPTQGAVLHSGVGAKSVAIGLLEDGSRVDVFDDTGTWYGVSCEGMSGYVSASELTYEDGEYYVSCQNDSAESRQIQTVAESELEAMQQAVVAEAESCLGTPYVWGGKRRGGFDCSGFVYYVYNSMGYSMGADAFRQLENGIVVEQDELQPGDVVFFTGTYWTNSGVSHVGIYIGDGMMIHASNSGIARAELFNGYYADHYLCARRVLLPGMTVHGIASGIH